MDMYHDYMELEFYLALNLVLSHRINYVGNNKPIYFANIMVPIYIILVNNLILDVVWQVAVLSDNKIVLMSVVSFADNNFILLNILHRHRMPAMYLHEVLLVFMKIYFFLKY